VIPTIGVRKISAFAVILIATCLVLSLEAKDNIRDKSPDGKFALRMRKGKGWDACSLPFMTNGQGTGEFPEGSETVTIVFDAEHKVSIQLGISAGVLETN
jgi:hypothetical protein